MCEEPFRFFGLCPRAVRKSYALPGTVMNFVRGYASCEGGGASEDQGRDTRKGIAVSAQHCGGAAGLVRVWLSMPSGCPYSRAGILHTGRSSCRLQNTRYGHLGLGNSDCRWHPKDNAAQNTLCTRAYSSHYTNCTILLRAYTIGRRSYNQVCRHCSPCHHLRNSKNTGRNTVVH